VLQRVGGINKAAGVRYRSTSVVFSLSSLSVAVVVVVLVAEEVEEVGWGSL